MFARIKQQFRRLRRAWRSWTFNSGAALYLLGEFHDNAAQFMPLIKLIIPTEHVAAFISAIGLVIIVLRFKTTKPLEER